jgi:hypothetical protein
MAKIDDINKFVVLPKHILSNTITDYERSFSTITGISPKLIGNNPDKSKISGQVRLRNILRQRNTIRIALSSIVPR